MKLLFDQNLSHRLIGLLATEFPGSQHVRHVGLAAAPDPAVWAYAAAHGLVIVSKDSDFQQRVLLLGHPAQGCVGASGELHDGSRRNLAANPTGRFARIRGRSHGLIFGPVVDLR